MKPICNNYSGIYVKFLVALFIGGFYSVASIAQPQKKNFDQHIRILEEIEVDSVTSDFPVEFSMVNSRKWQFIAYYNKNRELTVASRKLAKKKWNYAILPTKVGWDSHNSIAMALDKNNCLHISGNMHADSMVYFKTSLPNDIATFEKIVPIVSSADELKCTYPVFIKDPNNRLVYSYRKGGSGNGNTILNSYNEKKSTFSRLTDQPLFDGLGEMSAYPGGPIVGPDGYYHIYWLWRDTPRCETNHDLSYARSKDLIHWETLNATKISLPITPMNNVVTVDPVPAKGGAINGASYLFFDPNKQPLIAFMKYDSLGISQIYIAKAIDKKWKISLVSNWDYRWDFSGSGTMEREIKINEAKVLPDGKIKIKYWHIKKGYGELLIDKTNLTLIADNLINPDEDLEYPLPLMEPVSKIEGMSVKWLKTPSSASPKEYYGLRWETSGIQRYNQKPEKAVTPSLMKLYRFSKD